MAVNEGARKDGQFMVVCTAPDVCLTPPVPVPVPYQIVAFLNDSISVSSNVNFTGKPALMMKSRGTKVIGNEAGSAGGVKSGVNTDHCRPIEGTHSTTVRVNGQWVLYHQGQMYMNCAGPEGPANTIGKIIFLGKSATANVSVGPNGEVPPGDPCVKPETALEKNFLSGLGQRLTSPQGVIGLLQQGQQLANMDWSNPSSVLGALGGMAGLSDLDPLAKAAGLAAQGYNLTQMDWDNPLTALSALGMVTSVGGMAGGMLGGTLGNTLSQVSQHAGTAIGWGQKGLSLTQTNGNNPGSVMGAAMNFAGLGQLGQKVLPTSGEVMNLELVNQSPLKPAENNYLKLAKFSENLWKSNLVTQVEKCNSLIKNGKMIGDSNPRIVPETILEKSVGLAKNLFYKPTIPNDIHYPTKLAIDTNGKIIGLTSTRIPPETETELEFIKKLEKIKIKHK